MTNPQHNGTPVTIDSGDSKQTWHAPTIEEIDFGVTAASSTPGGPDFGFYTS